MAYFANVFSLELSAVYVIDQDVSPDGEPVELTYENGHYTVWVAGSALMSSGMHRSEREMAVVAAKYVGHRKHARVLIGGLGLGYTLRATLDSFSSDAEITVAELLPIIIRHHRGVLEPLAKYPLRDRRVTLFEGNVLHAVSNGPWDAALLDVDNGAEAFTVSGNAELYTEAGLRSFHDSLTPGGVLIIWSASPNRNFVRYLQSLGLRVRAVRTRAGGPEKKVKHTLFVIER